MFYDKRELRSKALKFYTSGKFFISFMNEEEIFPYSITLKRVSQEMIRRDIAVFHQEIEKLKSSKYETIYREFNFKSIGIQRLPVEIMFHKQSDFLSFIGKDEEFAIFRDAYERATLEFPILKELFLQKPKLLLKNTHIVDELLAICEFFINNPKPNIYTRELCILGVDTKFIEKNRLIVDAFLQTILDDEAYDTEIKTLSGNSFEKKYGLKYELATIRFRILDTSLYIGGFSDISVTIREFERLNIRCRRIFIVENKLTTLSFCDMDDAIVIFGSGYKVGILKSVEWMRDREIYYWGDIDMDGFAILSQARGYFPQIKSLMMDIKTLEQFKSITTHSNHKTYKRLLNLTKEEAMIYEAIYHDAYGKNIRLEQEKIPFSYVENTLKPLL